MQGTGVGAKGEGKELSQSLKSFSLSLEISFTQVKSQLRVQGCMKQQLSGKDNSRGVCERSR